MVCEVCGKNPCERIVSFFAESFFAADSQSRDDMMPISFLIFCEDAPVKDS
jgi:hypothetical protein